VASLVAWARTRVPGSNGEHRSQSVRLQPGGRLGYKEAPMLAERVAAGQLPPVEQRLPRNPFVQNVPQIGKYGGTMYDQAESSGGRFHLDGALIAGAQETDNDGQIIRPHLCDRVDVNADYSEFTFHIREGLKWSDGVDLTADDVLWWWQNEQRNPVIFPEGPRSFKVGNDYAEFSKLDRWTFRIKLPTPFRPCLNISASEWMAFGRQPAHWMKQFHADFNPKADELARQNGFGSCEQAARRALVPVGFDYHSRHLRAQSLFRRGRSGGQSAALH
jgi:peptide/nickel transport system substrate-binding protein